MVISNPEFLKEGDGEEESTNLDSMVNFSQRPVFFSPLLELKLIDTRGSFTSLWFKRRVVL